MSASTSLPSANTTVRSVSRAMFGFGVISPWAMRDRMSSEIVGCASQRAVVGLRQPVALHVADADPQQPAEERLRGPRTARPPGSAIWSSGLPNRYLGMTHAPRRAAR